MSGIYLEAARFARRRYGARLWFERGSRHILSQDRILAAIDGAERPSRLAVRRELAGYELADRIVVPSLHAEESFAVAPELRPKLFRNPYGVDLGMFPARARKPIAEPIALLYVGTWSLQKGCDLLEAAVLQHRRSAVDACRRDRRFAFPEMSRALRASRSGRAVRVEAFLCNGRPVRAGIAPGRVRHGAVAGAWRAGCRSSARITPAAAILPRCQASPHASASCRQVMPTRSPRQSASGGIGCAAATRSHRSARPSGRG